MRAAYAQRSECRLYQCSIRIKRRYAVLKGRRERGGVMLDCVQIASVTALYSGNESRGEIWSGQPWQCRPLLQWCKTLVRSVHCIEQPRSVLIVVPSNWTKSFYYYRKNLNDGGGRCRSGQVTAVLRLNTGITVITVYRGKPSINIFNKYISLMPLSKPVTILCSTGNNICITIFKFRSIKKKQKKNYV